MRSDGGGRNAAQSQKRRVFTKLLKDEHVTMTTVHQARRFLEGMQTFDSKADLLSKLEDGRDQGLRRLREVLSFVNSIQDVDQLFVPLLKHIITDETARPMYVPLRNRVLMAIYLVPALLDTIILHGVIQDLDQEAAKYVCLYLMAISTAFVEARNSDNVEQLSKQLRDRGDVNEARALCAVLLLDTDGDAKPPMVETRSMVKKRLVAMWVTDEIPPGGRHDNDHRNYRDIQIVPTADELCCETRSWLPLASGENNLIQDPAVRLLDKSFRLLREDAVFTMKANISEEGRVWKNARIIGLDITGSKKKGTVSFIVQCDPRPGGNPNWERSRAFMHGAVLAFCQDGIPKMMGVVTVREHEERDKWLNKPGGPIVGVAFDSSSDFQQALRDMQANCSYGEKVQNLNAKLAEAKQSQNHGELRKLEILFVGYKNLLETYDMVEASSSFFTYLPILKSLQAMSDLPFLSLLSEENNNNETGRPPEYLPVALSMPTDKYFNGYQCNTRLWSSEDIVSKTSLDLSQAEALHHTFTNPISLIQGPPGTGKTFIGALVARIIRDNTDESILCVCYTNHALDQFLEHMLAAGEKRIVRIGGRSKSEKLAAFQLRELARQKSSDRTGKFRRIKQVDAQLHRQRELILKGIESVKTPLEWKQPFGGVRQLLQDYHPDIYECLVVDNQEDGFHIIGPDSKPLQEGYLWNVWCKGEAYPDWLRTYAVDSGSARFEQVWALPHDERLAMTANWKNDIMEEEAGFLKERVCEFNTLRQERLLIQQEQDLEILQGARVIGATTTGAAQVKDLISSKAPGVVIIEEAGEVLEAHVLSVLRAETTKHLILIGDHQQLRPKVESYQLTTVSGGGYNLDCSLFERLVLSTLPSVTLGVQHRMRPEISAFIRKQTYPSLKDHASVKKFPNVKGVQMNVAFIDHSFPEDGESRNKDDPQSMKTKSNYPEAELCVELVRFFLLQGYSPDRIVILTPYLGQLMTILHLVRTRLKEAAAAVSEKDRRDLEEIEADDLEEDRRTEQRVRCSSIDNFQGEEADIVVGSLVRSNARGNIGFLKEEQRVNVFMSRARYGMFLVGNSATLRRSRQGQHVWNPILDDFQSNGQLVQGLPTYCQLHPDDAPVCLSTKEDFRTHRPNGGCSRLCQFRMECGHACRLNCHPFDRHHERVQKNCCEPCMRIPPECHMSHACSKLCKDECGPCRVKVGPIRLNCGHSRHAVQCHDTRNEEAIETLTKTCQQTLRHEFPGCGHEVDTTCANARGAAPICPAKCGKIVVKCSHLCVKECGRCNGDHSCGQKCERKMFCGHICGRSCHAGKDCPPCKMQCCATCPHSFCSKRCNAPCASCVEKCDWECKHRGRCMLVCGAPCSRLPCNERCTNLLKCGHRCPSLCAERCPDATFCQECGSDEAKSHVVDMIMFTAYEDQDVDEDPVIFLPCGHFFTVSTLDGHLSINEVYEETTAGSGEFWSVKPLRAANISEKPMTCPDCRSVIHSVKRYGRLLRLAELRSLERKAIMNVNETLKHISMRMEGSEHFKSESLIKRLKTVEQRLLQSPMRKVYEACRDDHAFEVPRPPTRPLLDTLELLGRAYSGMTEARDDVNFQLAKDAFMRGIALADETTSTRSGATLRLSLCSLIMKWPSLSDALKKEAMQLVGWVVDLQPPLPAELLDRALQMKNSILDPHKDIAEVLKAMNVHSDYNYGGSWSSHWYECPNGHPYFIGECWGAMQESQCIECGAPVGGHDHTLNSTNRRVGGAVAELLHGERRGA